MFPNLSSKIFFNKSLITSSKLFVFHTFLGTIIAISFCLYRTVVRTKAGFIQFLNFFVCYGEQIEESEDSDDKSWLAVYLLELSYVSLGCLINAGVLFWGLSQNYFLWAVPGYSTSPILKIEHGITLGMVLF